MALSVPANTEVKLALLLVDQDRFKLIDDQHGHAVGDAVLSICAQRVASVMRKDDVLARFGGDEFVLMLPGVTADETLERQIARVSAVLDKPIALAGTTMFARGSCGGALFTRDGNSLDQLVRVADARLTWGICSYNRRSRYWRIISSKPINRGVLRVKLIANTRSARASNRLRNATNLIQVNDCKKNGASSIPPTPK